MELPRTNEKETEIQRRNTIHDLPEIAVEKIMGYLSYHEVNKLGLLCRLFRRVASSVLRSGLRNLVSQIEEQVTQVENSSYDNAMTPPTVKEHLHIALLHTVLRILLAEAHMMRAVCWRYVREDIGFCFPGGQVLDEFNHVINTIKDREINKDLEPEITTRLFLKAERFYDLFESNIEPSIARLYSIDLTLFGVKLMDILDCCQNSNYKIKITHNSGEGPFCLSAFYELRDVSTLDAPPVITEHSVAEMKLRTICRYLRNNVRWINLFHPLKELWELEDTVETGNDDLKAKAISNHHKNHQIIMADFSRDVEEMRKPHWNNNGVYHKRGEVEDSNICEDEFTREMDISRSSSLAMTCTMTLHSHNMSQLPINYEFIASASPTVSPIPSIISSSAVDVASNSEENASLNDSKSLEKLDGASASNADPDIPYKDNSTKSILESSQSIFKNNTFSSLLTCNKEGKKFDFQLQMKIQHPTLSGSELMRQTVITVQQADDNVLVTSDGDIVPYY
ncbi:hypothetical protein L9F63_012192 [Diploptera punctata]|uniref:F-box domain-containing protein n=1 Tax=Diploptera punctata TaxID=6984 RepID=A0AAD8AD30_DIPPU|nr:hypothetical protein L9F63_012192 [Diploptera punctata]